ncbi:MAG: glycosyltransferase family 2 protein [Paludibacteraceae bacterium]|nr:glycosyltransferase family 2 protein [Paludibacteraceae bacterium]
MSPKVSVIIINWNGSRFLRTCINSILESDYENTEIIVIDNASEDDSVEIIKSYTDKVKLEENENIGYAAGANKGISMTNGEYVLIANPDVVFTKSYIRKLVEFAEKNENCASLTGKLLKYDFENNTKLDIIDSTGIRLDHSRHGYDIGHNQPDNGQHETSRRVFATCGAASMYRRNALNAIKQGNDFFDSDFFAYKEDIDLGWRLNLCGLENWYVADAIAYHGRTMNSGDGIMSTIKNKKDKNLQNGLSLRNHYLMLMKNESRYTLCRDFHRILLNLLKYILFYLFTSPRTLKSLLDAASMRRKFRNKSKDTFSHKTIDNKAAYKLFDL